MFISCKKASELIAKKELKEISYGERLKLRLHTTMCKVCGLYQKQSAKLHQALQRYYSKKKKEAPAESNDTLKDRIISDL